MALPRSLRSVLSQFSNFRTVNIAADHLAPVVPSRGDKVKVILGDEDKDMTGQLLSIDSQVGITVVIISPVFLLIIGFSSGGSCEAGPQWRRQDVAAQVFVQDEE